MNTPQTPTSAPGEPAGQRRARSRGYWWIGLVAGIAWLVISLVILQFDSASITTIGVLVGLMFLPPPSRTSPLTTLPVEHRWVPALFSVLFLDLRGDLLRQPRQSTFAGLADMLGFLFLLVGVWWMTQAFLERPRQPDVVARPDLGHPHDRHRLLGGRPALRRRRRTRCSSSPASGR